MPDTHEPGTKSRTGAASTSDAHAIHTGHGPRGPAAGHDKHAGHSVAMFRDKFWGTLLLSIPTIIWAPMIQAWFGYAAPGGAMASRWVPAIFGTAVFAYGGWVFIRGALGEIRDRLPGMMTLISLAISVAFVFSLAVTFGFPGSDLWWSWRRSSPSWCLGTGSRCGQSYRREAPSQSWRSCFRIQPFAWLTIGRKRWQFRISRTVMSFSFGQAPPSRPTASSATGRAT